MAIDTIKSFINSYTPQNAFSFEFCKRDKQTGKPARSQYPLEIYLTVGPTQYSETFRFRINYEPTFNSGTSVVDMGAGNSQIKLDGELHIYHYDIPRSSPPQQEYVDGVEFKDVAGNFINKLYQDAKESIINKYQRMAGVEVRSGVEEFFDLMALLFYIRVDLSIPKPKLNSQAHKIINFFANIDSFNYSDYCLLYHDYDRNRHVEVIIPSDGFTISRSTRDTNTYQYSINLVVIRNLEGDVRVLAPKTGQSPLFILNNAISDIQNLINFPLKLSGLLVNIADGIKQVTSTGQLLVNTFNNMKNRFTADGKLASSTFQGAVDDINRALGRKPNSSFLEEIDNALQEYQDLLYEASNGESNFGSLVAQAQAQVQSLVNIIGFILNPPNITGNPVDESLLPNADSSNLINNSTYQWLIIFEDLLTTVASNYKQASIDDSYRIYYGSNSDSFELVARDILGDDRLAGALAYYNKRGVNEIIAGQAIRLPYGEKSNIYYLLPENFTRQDLEYGIFGFDLALTSDRDFAIAPNGDLAVTEGITTLIENIVDILDIPIGSWIIDRSIGNPILIGELIEEYNKGSIVPRLLQQLESDTRIKSARIVESSQDGGRISYLLRITPAAGGEINLRL